MPIDLDHDDASRDWIKHDRFVYTEGEVGIPRSDAETADELLAFLNVDDSDIETQRRPASRFRARYQWLDRLAAVG